MCNFFNTKSNVILKKKNVIISKSKANIINREYMKKVKCICENIK